MKKILTLSFSLIALLFIVLVAGVLIAPSVIDWDAYKSQAQEQIKSKMGYDVVFNGDVSLGIFPAPHVSLSDVVVKSPAGFKSENLATLGALDVRVALAPLFTGAVEVSSIVLDQADITLEAKADGSVNWMSPELKAMSSKKAGAGDGDGEKSTGPQISLNQISISQGRMSYVAAGQKPVVVEQINLDIDAETLQGPFDIQGRFLTFEQNVSFETTLKDISDMSKALPLVLNVKASPANVALMFDGAVDMQALSAQGKVEVQAAQGDLKGDIVANKDKVTVRNMRANGMGYSAEGQVSSTLNPVKFDGQLKTEGADFAFVGAFDKVLTIAVNAKSVDFDVLMKKKPSKPSGGNSKGGASSQAGGKKGAVPIDFDVNIARAVYQGNTIKNVFLKGRLDGSALNLKKFTVANFAGASAQGRMSVANINALSGLKASISSQIPDVRAFATAMKLDASAVPASVKKVSIKVDADGDLKAMNVDASVGAAGASFGVKGLIKNPTSALAMDGLTVRLKHKNLNSFLKVFAPSAPRYASLGKTLDVSTRVDMSGKVLSLTGIKGVVGGASLSGDLSIDQSAAKPNVKGSLSVGDLVLQQAGSAPAGGRKSSAGAGTTGAQKWSNAAIDSRWLNGIDLDLNLSAKSLVYQSWDLKSPSIRFAMKDGVLNIKDLKAGLYGGTLSMDAVLKAAQADGKGLDMSANTAFVNVDLQKLAGSMTGAQTIKAEGKANLTAHLKGVGVSQRALVSALSGQGALTGQNIVLKGFDLARFARSMNIDAKPGDSLSGLWKSAGRDGQTQFDTMDGAYTISQGIVKIAKFDLDGPAALMQTTGSVNLPKWTISTKHKITAKGEDVPPFTLEISGPLDNPGQTFGQGAIQNYLQQKLQRKLGKVLGGDGSESIEKQLLNKFLGGKAKKKEVPVQQGDTPSAQSAPQPEPQKSRSPEDELKGLLKGLFD